MNLIAKLFPLYLVIFIGFLGYSLMITIFTPMLMQSPQEYLPPDTSLSTKVIILGVLLSLYPLGQFFGSSVMGALSDRYGRKPLLLISIAVTTLCYIGIVISLKLHNLKFLMLFSLIAGLAESNIALAQSTIADLTSEKERNQYFGLIYLSASSAYIVGPLLGGKLAAWFSDPVPFSLVTLLLALTLLWIATSFKETKKEGSIQKIRYAQAFTNILQVITSKELRPYYAINFLIYVAVFGFFRCYPMYMIDAFKMGVSKESEFIAWVAVPIILANAGITTWLSQRYSAFAMTIVSALSTGLFMIIVILPSEMNALWITLFLTGMALAICLPSCATLLSLKAKKEEQGRVMGNNQSLQVGAEALSAILGGLFAAVFISLPLIILGLMAIIAALALYAAKRTQMIS